ncbi:glycosyltransferase family 39 protein [Oculatella sp. LEGE 06141]|uniref:ArnT family glycosyltransferase n=1 Tax=Oculatella sp. LEGE 06141 TaxID=1828648 RepID=UPI00188127C7|nr:glycosyltransferase family 39 protein [Oculatella sp. LEGE 06141]MBE9181748.1 glycosyltransferase family 39 protein [Oculatella sp. LEGE 06141]
MSYRTLLVDESEEWLHRSYNKTDWFWSIGLVVAAIVLFTINLGGLPLRDWDEGLVAQVAREIWQSPPDSLNWLFPSLWGEPYSNKPPLMHGLIAAAFSVIGVNEWAARLPGALLTALSVPLLYGIGREIFHHRSPAVFSAFVYLTFLPVVRQGRLAMLDGAILSFMLLMLWCVLLARRDRRFAVGIGIGLGLICLTKGVMVAVLMGAIAILFLLWDTPRLLTLPYLWLGIVIGGAPAVLWYVAQWLHYGPTFLNSNLVNQSLRRVWAPVENNGGYPWFYLLEVIKYSAPWLLFLPLGFRLTWFNRNLSWAKLVLVWSGVYFLSISVMVTKLPWYVLPLYPALALVTGAQLAMMWKRGLPVGAKYDPYSAYSPVWFGAFVLLAAAGWIGMLYFGMWSDTPEPDLQVVLASVGLTMTAAAVLVVRQNPQFIAVLLWGMYISLLLLMVSEHWIWELAESYPVRPVAAIVQQHTPPGTKIYTSYEYSRPSLNFYSDRQVIALSRRQLQQRWQKDLQPYFLLDEAATAALALDSSKVLETVQGWTLLTKDG